MEHKDLHIKPKRSAYLIMAGLRSVGIFTVLTFFLSFFMLGPIIQGFSETDKASGTGLLLLVFCLFLIFLVIFGLVMLNAVIAYNKESYTLAQDRIIIRRGGIFTNSQTEMVYRNFTFIDLKLPFVEHSLFNTGELSIKSSGSSLTTDIILANLVDHQLILETISARMHENGFNLDKEKMVFDTYPDTTAIVLNIIRKNSSFTTLLFAINIVFSFISIGMAAFLPVLIVTAILSLLIIVAATFIRFQDLKKRHYQVYSGLVQYNKGFLTKHDAFIPVENLSDSVTSQSFLQKIFDVFDIEISSKGVATEIIFKNLKNGPDVENAIDSIIATYNKRKTEAKVLNTTSTAVSGAQNVANAATTGQATHKKELNVDETRWSTTNFQANFKMNMSAALIKYAIGSIGAIFSLFIIILVFTTIGSSISPSTLIYFVVIGASAVFTFVGQFLRIFFTKYAVLENSIKEEYTFLSTRNKEFNIQKITGMVIIRDLVDRLIGSCSVKFISIGSSQDITFQTISFDQEFLSALKAKLSFVEAESGIKEIKSSFNFKDFILSNVAGYVFLVVLVIFVTAFLAIMQGFSSEFQSAGNWIFLIWVGLVLLMVVGNLLSYLYGSFYHKKTSLVLFKDRLVLKKGLITLSESYARFSNIKNVSATQYPFTKNGTLQVNIAGELIPVQPNQKQNQYQQQQQQTNNAALLNLGNKLIIPFTTNVFETMDITEEFLQHRIDTAKMAPASVLIETKSSMVNSIVPYILLSFILPPLWLGLPFAIYYVYKRRFVVEADRVVSYAGIINITKTSVLFARIDNINIREGMWNKVFKTATILIETMGSIGPTLTIQDIPNHKEVYDLLKKEYSNKA